MANTDTRIKKTILLTKLRKYTMLIALVAIWLIFTMMTKGVFISSRNLSNLFLQSVAVAIVSLGMTLVIVTRNIDLSVGSVAALAGAMAAFLQVQLQWPTPMALLGALVLGMAIGAWHGFWIAYRYVPAFIVTLASMMIFRGAVLGLTKGATIAPLSDSFRAIGQQFLPHDISFIIGVLTVISYIAYVIYKRRQRKKFGFTVAPLWSEILQVVLVCAVIFFFFATLLRHRGLAYAVVLLMFLALLFHFISQNTVFGRQLYAIGGNPDAAALSGVNIRKRIMMLYVIFGVLTAIAGVVFTARLNAATTSAGVGMELDVIAASVIGGTSLMGGEGTVIGAIVGALIMSSLDNGMSLMDTDITFQYVIKGLILLLAVWIDIATKKK